MHAIEIVFRLGAGMGSPKSELTSLTLLDRVGKDSSDHAAWGEFVAYYGPKIRTWCCQRGLQSADADDVTQNVLLRLARRYGSSPTIRRRSFGAGCGW